MKMLQREKRYFIGFRNCYRVKTNQKGSSLLCANDNFYHLVLERYDLIQEGNGACGDYMEPRFEGFQG